MEYEKHLDLMLRNLNDGKSITNGFSDYWLHHKGRLIDHLRQQAYIVDSEITIKGRIFINSGGYEKQLERLIYEQSLIPKMAEWQKRLSLWTLILGIATSGILLLELIHFFCEIF